MRILLASDTYPPDVNGAAIFTSRLARSLVRSGHEVVNVSPSPDSRARIEVRDGVRIYRIPSFRVPWHESFHVPLPSASRAIVRKSLREFRPDVVHVQAHFAVGRAAIVEANIAGIPTIATSHFMPENLLPQIPITLPRSVQRWLKRLAWRQLRRVFRRARLVTTPTKYAASLLREHAALPAVTEVSCGVDTSYFVPPAIPRAAGGATVLFVGRIESEKNLETLVRAVPMMRRPVRVRLVGSGSDTARIRAIAESLGVADLVDFVGYVADSALLEEYWQADVFCMPGSAELQSIASLEALATGLPIVAADAGALPHLVENGLNGRLFAAGDATGLANAVDEVLRLDRRVSGDASRAFALSHDETKTTLQYLRLYEALSKQFASQCVSSA